MPNFNQIIHDIRAKLGPPPRRVGLLTRWKFQQLPPKWMAPSDQLQTVHRNRIPLLQRGKVVWGSIVQANNLLFSPGPLTHPALIAFATSDAFDAEPQRLRDISGWVFSLKHTTPSDPLELKLAQLVTDELDRGGFVVPGDLIGGVEIRGSALLVYREHIPGGFLRSGILPLLISDSIPAVMIVPSEYWPPELVALWQS
jgi:hypothetical protein